MKQVLSIQYLRAVAALGVVAFHQAHTGLPAGAAGVDLFFVISGFIMFVVTEDRETTPGKFLERRLLRIAPFYWCVTMLTVAICLIWPDLLWHSDISLPHILTSLLFIPHHAVIGGVKDLVPTVGQGWSLNIEMFFYILVTLALFFPRRLQLGLLSVILAALAAVGWYLHPLAAIPMTYTNPMLLELLAGLWLGQFWTWGALPGARAGAALIAAGVLNLCFVQAWGLDEEQIRPNVAAILIVLGALSIEANKKMRPRTSLKILGDSSYAIYLLHAPVVAAIRMLQLPMFVSVPASLILSAGAGVCAYLWCEKPILAAFRKRPPWRGRRRTAAKTR